MHASDIPELRLRFSTAGNGSGYHVALHRNCDAVQLAGDDMAWPDQAELEHAYLRPLRNYLTVPVDNTFQEAFGARLADLLPPAVRQMIQAECLKEGTSSPYLTLGITPLSRPPWFAGLPWEFLRLATPASGIKPDFVALQPHCNIIRAPENSICVQPISAEPLRVIIVCSDPRTAEYPELLQAEEEVSAIQDVLEGRRDRVEIEVIRYASPTALKARLKELAPHILHYIGHGKERASGGILALDNGGGVEEVYGSDLADWLTQSALRLVILSACQTGAVDHGARSIAQELERVRVPAVVAMQMSMRDVSARLFSTALYRRLLETGCIVQAVWDARQATRGMGLDWGVPSLHLAGGSGKLFITEHHISLLELQVPVTLPPSAPEMSHIVSNVPAPLDVFVGRRQECSHLISLIKRPTTRCATLIGAAGIGKTRLALHVGALLNESMLVVFVELHEIGDPDQILACIADSLSLEVAPNHDVLHTILRSLNDKSVLLILDNFEHVRSGAHHVRQLLERLPALKALVTSREPLNIRGEYKIDLDPLEIPSPGASHHVMRRADSVKLLAERAKAASHRFKLSPHNVAEAAAICRTLEGLPLGIEIVAAQIRDRPLSHVLADLKVELLDTKSKVDGMPLRQQSLRAAFDWSFHQLSERERIVFMEVSLFETSFGFDDAAEVCTVDEVRSPLYTLRDRSLVQYDSTDFARPFRLLIPVREYAASHLGRIESAARDRFVGLFAGRAIRLRESFYTETGERGAVEAFRMDVENFRSALTVVQEEKDTELVARMGLAVVSFAPELRGRARFDDWMEPTERALQTIGDSNLLSKFYNLRARIASLNGDYAQALGCQQHALAHWYKTGNESRIADAHSTLAWFAMRAREYNTAVKNANAAIPLAHSCGDAESEAVALCVLARVSIAEAAGVAEGYAQRSLELFRQINGTRGQAHAYMALGEIAEARGDLAAAKDSYTQAVRLSWVQRDDIQTLMSLGALANLLASSDPSVFVSRLLKDVAHLQRSIGLSVDRDAAEEAPGGRGEMDRSQSVADVVMYVRLEMSELLL